jgi:hypothetical protein
MAADTSVCRRMRGRHSALAVASDVPDRVLDEIEVDLLRALPFPAWLPEACLYVFDGDRWRPSSRLPFSKASDART